jgi:hypothetical protein
MLAYHPPRNQQEIRELYVHQAIYSFSSVLKSKQLISDCKSKYVSENVGEP